MKFWDKFKARRVAREEAMEEQFWNLVNDRAQEQVIADAEADVMEAVSELFDTVTNDGDEDAIEHMVGHVLQAWYMLQVSASRFEPDDEESFVVNRTFDDPVAEVEAFLRESSA